MRQLRHDKTSMREGWFTPPFADRANRDIRQTLAIPSDQTTSKQYQRAGFTLIEVLVVIVIFSFVLVVFLNIFDWSNANYAYQQGYFRATTSARQTMTDMHSALLQSSRVLSSRSFGGVPYTSGAATLILELPSIDSSGTIIDNTWDYMVFYSTNGSLYMVAEINPASARVLPSQKLLSDSVESLVFTYDNADFTQVGSVEVALTTAVATVRQTARSSFTQTVYLRNK